MRQMFDVMLRMCQNNVTTKQNKNRTVWLLSAVKLKVSCNEILYKYVFVEKKNQL